MGCPCARIRGLSYTPFEMLVSGWLNGEGDNVYVGDDFAFPAVISEYTFPGMSYVKDVAGATGALNLLCIAAGRNGDVFTIENGTFNGTDYDFELWKYNTGTDSSALLGSFTRPFSDVPRLIFSFYDDFLYAMFSPAADAVILRLDPGTGADTLIYDATSNSEGVTGLTGRPCYTSDGFLWQVAETATDWGLVGIDLDTDTPTFTALQTTVSGSGEPAADDAVVYVSFYSGATQTNYQITGGVDSVVSCVYTQTPFLGVLDENNRGLYQGFDSDIQIWHWTCGRWWLGVAGWG